ncbi:MAG: hypothetical protein SGPRY_010472 [Prymnesium sp.]
MAVKMVHDVIKHAGAPGASQASRKSLAQAAADALVKRASELGSLDNTTALVALLDWG